MRAAKALIAEFHFNLGEHYAIGLEAVNAQTGDVSSRELVEAENKEQGASRARYSIVGSSRNWVNR